MDTQHFSSTLDRPEDRETLLRTVRFATIQLQKFWIEIQSFPVFMGGLDEASLQDVERLFEWLRTSPNWAAELEAPDLVPALLETSSRRGLLEFARNVKCIRALRAEAAEMVTPQTLGAARFRDELWRLRRCAEVLGARPDLVALSQEEVTARLSDLRSELDRLRRVTGFFAGLHRDFGVPVPFRPSETRGVFRYLECLEAAPASVLSWRLPQILHPSNKLRLEAWAGRARPLLEQAAEIEAKFESPEAADPSMLRAIAEGLRAGGWLKSFGAAYRQSIQEYRKLLTPEAAKRVESGKLNESAMQMADSLDLWARWIEQSASFAENAEGIAVFGVGYKGARTDFTSAVRAHGWAQEMRVELGKTGRFSQSLLKHLFGAETESLEQARALAQSPECSEVQQVLRLSEFSSDAEFDAFEARLISRIQDLERVEGAITGMCLREDLRVGDLIIVLERFEEIEFLLKQIDSLPLPKSILGRRFQGAETRLEPLEQALAYVRSVESAHLPAKLHRLLLAAQGPQRLQENRKLVAPAMYTLGLVKEHLGRVETASQGKFLARDLGPIPGLMADFKEILGQPFQHGNA